jgi:hypothetical protein
MSTNMSVRTERSGGRVFLEFCLKQKGCGIKNAGDLKVLILGRCAYRGRVLLGRGERACLTCV